MRSANKLQCEAVHMQCSCWTWSGRVIEARLVYFHSQIWRNSENPKRVLFLSLSLSFRVPSLMYKPAVNPYSIKPSQPNIQSPGSLLHISTHSTTPLKTPNISPELANLPSHVSIPPCSLIHATLPPQIGYATLSCCCLQESQRIELHPLPCQRSKIEIIIKQIIK